MAKYIFPWEKEKSGRFQSLSALFAGFNTKYVFIVALEIS